MKAFISYSHANDRAREKLNKNLAPMQRDGLIDTWADHAIPAGGILDEHISRELQESDLFLALLSPDYLNSNYCYTKEFEWALQQQAMGRMIIVPIILTDCDWLNTPFRQFKVLPKDGKAISAWRNKDAAFLNIIQGLRKLLCQPNPIITAIKDSFRTRGIGQEPGGTAFDTIQKLDFIDDSFQELKGWLEHHRKGGALMEHVQVRTITDIPTKLEYIMVNRKKKGKESTLLVTTTPENIGRNRLRPGEGHIRYQISASSRPNHGFTLVADADHLYWREGLSYGPCGMHKEMTTKEMADIILKEWLEGVGVT